MNKLREILIKIKDALVLIEDQFLFFVPEKYRAKVRNIINGIVILIGAVLAVIALF